GIDVALRAAGLLRETVGMLRAEAEARYRDSFKYRNGQQIKQSMARVAARQAAVQERVDQVHARVAKIHEARMAQVQARLDRSAAIHQKRMDEMHQRVQARIDAMYKRRSR